MEKRKSSSTKPGDSTFHINAKTGELVQILIGAAERKLKADPSSKHPLVLALCGGTGMAYSSPGFL
jgi:hypothetical protein